MSDKVTVKYNGGLGFGSLLTLIFITLKLVGAITWPWVWVLCPIWIPLAVGIGILIVAGIFYLIAALIR